jgi:hypothetical protein
MAKLTAWLVTLIGVLLVLALVSAAVANVNTWLVPVLVLVVGVGKLTRNYSGKKR